MVGYLVGAVLALVVLWPFAIASSTALALGTAGGYDGLGALILAALLLAVVQLAITAWVTQHASSMLADAPVRFRRALGAVFLGYLVNLVAGPAAAGVADLPVLGGGWVGLVVVALVVSSGPAAPQASTA